jgi:hypothetical protein
MNEDYKWMYTPIEPKYSACDICDGRPNVFEELFRTIKDNGYHEDIIARIKYALMDDRGMTKFYHYYKLGNFNTEDFVQAMLKVYGEITK